MSSNPNSYIELDMLRVSQLQGGAVFSGKIKLSELMQIYKLHERKENIRDPLDHAPQSDAALDFNNQEFQRHLSHNKLGKIRTYLSKALKAYLDREQGDNSSSVVLFPSSLILYSRLAEEDEDSDETHFYQPSGTDHSSLYKLRIPMRKASVLIVDGQHRFVGTKEFYESLRDSEQAKIMADFEFIITFLVGFDIYEVGQIFANVNFNQKPVNRSLYYDIFGSAPLTDSNDETHNEIRLAHLLALHMNNSEKSPLNNMFKLLGKGRGLFSQAFFVDKLLNDVFPSHIWDEQLASFQDKGDNYKILGQFLRDYFSALKDAYPTAWPKPFEENNRLVYSSYKYKYILCKTTGLGAYFRLIREIYPLVKDKPDNFYVACLRIFNKISDADAAQLFSSLKEAPGPYAGGGSEGMQKNLYAYLKERYGLEPNLFDRD